MTSRSAWVRWCTTSSRRTTKCKIAYPNLLFGRSIIDGRGMMCSVLTLTVENQGMGGVEYGKIYDIYFPPEVLRLFDGPSGNIMDMTNVSVCTTDDFTKCVGALVYYVDLENEECKIAYPNLLFDRNIIDGRGMMCSVLTQGVVSSQGMGAFEYGKIYDIYFPPGFLRLFDGPSCNIMEMTNVNICTTDDFKKCVGALVYYIDPGNEECNTYPNLLFDRNIIDGRGMMCSVLTLTIGNNQGMGDVEYGKIYDIYFPPEFLRLFDGPSCNIMDMWRILGRGTSSAGLVVGTIIKPKLGLQPKPFGEACYSFWQGGDFIKNDEPQGNQVFCQMNECIPEVVKAMRAAIKETGISKLFSANITADDPAEMIARGKYIMSQFGPLAENCAFLVDGYVAGGTAVTVARRNFPKQFLHYHRAGHGAVTSPQTQRGYTAFVHTKLSRVQGASGIHVGTMSFGKMEGDASDKGIAFMLQDDVAPGPYYEQEWEGMAETTPIISGAMNGCRGDPAGFKLLWDPAGFKIELGSVPT